MCILALSGCMGDPPDGKPRSRERDTGLNTKGAVGKGKQNVRDAFAVGSSACEYGCLGSSRRSRR